MPYVCTWKGTGEESRERLRERAGTAVFERGGGHGRVGEIVAVGEEL